MSRWPNKFVIGLTGNIGVGKSVVRQMVQHLGAYTIDADGLSHQAMSPGAPAYKPVVETFGMFVLNEDKSINRAKLAQMVFLHPEALRRLEAITHPVVGQAINALISRSKQRVVVVEAIKLLEGDLAKAVDEVWVVDAKPETQLQRLMQKRNMPEADAKRRIAAQNPQADKIAKATVVINNDGNVEETWKQVQAAFNKAALKFAPPATTAPTSPSMQAVRPGEATIPSTANQTVPMRGAPPSRADQAAARPLSLEVKRGMPNNAELIANFINKNAGKTVSRMDVMMAFGQKSYLLVMATGGPPPGDERIVALMGWQVENLITRVDEFYIEPGIPLETVVQALVTAVEDASRELQSEVGFVFLPTTSTPIVLQVFSKNGYEVTSVETIKIPAWREAVQEMRSDKVQILTKKLREDRVLKPI